MRALIAPVTAYLICFVLVTLIGLLFLPEQPLGTTLVTDAPGRSIWIAVAVLVVALLCEMINGTRRAGRGRGA